MRENSVLIIDFRKTNILLMVLLSLLTLGIYNAYWFLSRKKYFNSLDAKDWIPYKWWVFMFIFLVLSFIYSLFGSSILTEYGTAVLDSFDLIFSFYFVGCLYYSVFRAKEMIESHLEEGIFNVWFLVIFNIWYVQYKINRLDKAGRALL